ncbi:MAG: PEP/pyruvate-binding domain-containing protein [Kiritimatiellia bacterium]
MASKKNDKQYVYFYGFGKKYTEGGIEHEGHHWRQGRTWPRWPWPASPSPAGFSVSTGSLRLLQQPQEGPASRHDGPGQAEAGPRWKSFTGKPGDPRNSLLVSVRSGAAVSMPGMMDTVLELGLNDRSAQGFIQQTGQERTAWDCYRRFIDMFGDVVMGPASGLTHHDFEVEMEALKRKYGAAQDTDLTADQLKELVEIYKKVYLQKVKKPFPQDPIEQLECSIQAVFNSWNSERAEKYRQINKIQGLIGTAVNICTMVFGNMGDESGTGVAFTRRLHRRSRRWANT